MLANLLNDEYYRVNSVHWALAVLGIKMNFELWSLLLDNMERFWDLHLILEALKTFKKLQQTMKTF